MSWKTGPCPPRDLLLFPATTGMEAPLPGQPVLLHPLPRKLQLPCAQHQSQARILWGQANQTAINEESSTVPWAFSHPGSPQQSILLK